MRRPVFPEMTSSRIADHVANILALIGVCLLATRLIPRSAMAIVAIVCLVLTVRVLTARVLRRLVPDGMHTYVDLWKKWRQPAWVCRNPSHAAEMRPAAPPEQSTHPPLILLVITLTALVIAALARPHTLVIVFIDALVLVIEMLYVLRWGNQVGDRRYSDIVPMDVLSSFATNVFLLLLGSFWMVAAT